MKVKEAIILAGGKGTRLQSVVADLPKPIAPVGGIPFLNYQLDYLIHEGIEHVVVSACYLHEKIQAQMGTCYRNLRLSYAIEAEPLGTGGAIQHAMPFIAAKQVLILNGDTYFPCPLARLIAVHVAERADLTLALREVSDTARYGGVRHRGNRVIGFSEKGVAGRGLINGGMYLMNTKALEDLGFESKYSFEIEAMPRLCEQKKVCGVRMEAYFIDMGIPEDYQRAQLECVSWGLDFKTELASQE